MAIKLVSVNIEGQKHLDKVKAFLHAENADIVCLMEVYGSDVAWIAQGYSHVVYGPNNVVSAGETLGVAMLSKAPITRSHIVYCDGKSAQTLEVLGEGTHSPVVVMAVVGGYQIAATHFTWTPGGTVTERQRQHVAQLLALTKGEEFVFAGDFNIPRGNEMYKKLLTNYRDNVPTDIETTIDPSLHYANRKQQGKLKLVVDYIWSTPQYRVSDVRVVSGVSDHCALVCAISTV